MSITGFFPEHFIKDVFSGPVLVFLLFVRFGLKLFGIQLILGFFGMAGHVCLL